MSRIDGRVALVTGAARGIGRATAVAFARAGARLVVADRDRAGAEALFEALNATGADWRFAEADVTSDRDCAAMVRAAIEGYGRLDCAVNNAGIAEGPPSRLLADYPDELWDRVIAVNLGGVFRCLRQELRVMGLGASIVNIASVAGAIAFPGVAGYVASKHGVVGLTKAVAVEYGPKGIRCNAIGPGFTDTRMLPAGSHDWMRSVTPLGRLAAPEEIAHAAVWLCGDHASFINGAHLPVDGGFLSQ